MHNIPHTLVYPNYRGAPLRASLIAAAALAVLPSVAHADPINLKLLGMGSSEIVTVGGVRNVTAYAGEISLAADNHIKNRRGYDRPDHLCHHVRDEVLRLETPRYHQANRHCRVEMSSRDAADGISHRQHGETKCEGNAEQSYPNVGEGRRQDCAAAAPKH